MSAAPDDYPANPATTGKIAVATSVVGSFDNGIDEDWHAIDLVGGTSYLFTLKSNGVIPDYGYFALAVFDADGRQLTNVVQGDEPYAPILNFTAPATGKYFVAPASLYRWYGLGSYTLEAAVRTGRDDYAATASTPAAFTRNGAVTGRFETGGDADWFRFRAEVGVHYVFNSIGPEFGSDPASSVYPSNLRIVDATGREYGYPGSFDPIVSGDYYLEVLGFNAGDYQVVQKTWNDDYPHTPATAGTLPAGGRASGVIDYETDIDPFRVQLDAGGLYTFTLTGDLNFYRLELTGPGNVRLTYALGNNDGGGLALTFDPSVSGDYYLNVSHLLQSRPLTTPLQYVIAASPMITDDVGDTAANAAPATIGVNTAGQLQAAPDIDVFKYSLIGGVKYAFAVQAGKGTEDDLTLRFEDVKGIQYLRDSAHTPGLVILAAGPQPWLGFTPPTSGDYFVSVATGTYGAHDYQIKSLSLSGDSVGPVLVASSHPAGASGVPLAARQLSLTFGEPIKIVDPSAIKLTNSKGEVMLVDNGPFSFPMQVDNQLLYNLYNVFLQPDTYTLSLPRSALTDLAGNSYQGMESMSFTTVLPVTSGSAGNDLFLGGEGRTLNGGAGIDSVLYGGRTRAELITRDGANATIKSSSGSVDTLLNVERLLLDYQGYALDIDGNAGQAYRLYQAAFHRVPDFAGVGYWISRLDKGMPLQDVAGQFVASGEFKSLYDAAPTDAAYIDLLYQNVLGRSPDAPGYSYWEKVLQSGYAREGVLVQFSESAENKAALIGVIGNGFEYKVYE